jgi:N-methylhydantoinase A
MLQVGPRSAGAAPGPACYGFGGSEATTTDANVVRGLIRPGHFLGGALDLDVGAAHLAVAQVAESIGQEAAETAENIARIADVTMSNALRLVSTERGYDPRRYTLVAYGGAGPLHAAGVAEQLNIDRILIPPYPGLLSAFGLLAGRFQRDFARTRVTALDDAGFASLEKAFAILREQAHQETTQFNVDPESCAETLALDMRYRGQGYELTLPLTKDGLALGSAVELAERFHAYHRQRYGHATPHEPVEIVTLRLILNRAFDTPPHLRTPTNENPGDELAPIVIDGAETACRFLWRAALPHDFNADGPVVIEEPTATTYVPPGWRVRVDAFTNLRIERSEAG